VSEGTKSMIEEQPGRDWRDLQCRVAAILQECGLAAETGKSLATARGTTEIDVYATDPTTAPQAVYLCECKRWATRVPQGEIQTFRTVVADAGAHLGLFISAQGFQSGAHDVVQHTNIHLVDWVAFQKLFLERWCTRFWIPTVRTGGDPLAGHVEPPESDAAVRHFYGETIEPAEAIGLFVHDMWGPPFNPIVNVVFGRPAAPVATAIWERREKYRAFLPQRVAEATFLRDLLESILAFLQDWSQR